MTPLLSTMPTIQGPITASSVSFPALSAPAATNQSDRQDRPPRSV